MSPYVSHQRVRLKGRLPLSNAYSHTLDSLLGERLGIGLGRISGDAPNLELLGSFWVAQNGLDDRAALLASGSEHNENLLCGHGSRCG